MVSQLFLVGFLLASIFSCICSMGDDFSHLPGLTELTPILVRNGTQEILLNYFSSEKLATFVKKLEKDHSNIVKVRSLGSVRVIKDLHAYHGNIPHGIMMPISLRRNNVNDQHIWAVQISRDVTQPRTLLKPMFKFVANINGDDAVGFALMVALIQYLVYSDGHDERITRMLNTTDIWILPTINPKGFARSKMGRCDSVRDYFNYRKPLDVTQAGVYEYAVDEEIDKQFKHKSIIGEEMLYDDGQFPLDIADRPQDIELMLSNFIAENPFVLSGNLQGGALVVSYPWDYNYNQRNKKRGGSGLTQDNQFFVKVAGDYARTNPMMAHKNGCSQNVRNGIANGNSWRQKLGSMQDFNYAFSNCFEVTLYLGCCRYPFPRDLPYYWHANLESMLKFIENTHLGVYGLVLDDQEKPVKGATIKVRGIDKEIKVTERGEYWRLLDPVLENSKKTHPGFKGYDVTASADGYNQMTVKVFVTGKDPYVRCDFVLTVNRPE